MSTPLAIILTNELSELERVSQLVESFGQQHGLTARIVFELNLALDEILTNIMSYAYVDEGEHCIIVRVTAAPAEGPTELYIEVEDDGQPFDPTVVAAPDLERPLADRSAGGLGIHLVRRVMDDLAYRRQQDRNVLSMKKQVGGKRGLP